MIRLRSLHMAFTAILILGAGATISARLKAQHSDDKTVVPKEKNLVAGEKEAKKMLRLMDTDKSGKISKKEFMAFMEAEFERLDINHDGELDVKELTNSQVQIRTRGR